MEKQEDRKMGKITDIIFDLLRNLFALFLALAITVRGCWVWDQMVSVQHRTEAFSKGFDIGTASETDVQKGEVDGFEDFSVFDTFTTMPGSDIKLLKYTKDLVTKESGERSTIDSGYIQNTPLTFWEYSSDFFTYYLTSIIISILITSKKIMGKKRWEKLFLWMSFLMSFIEILMVNKYSSGLVNYKGAQYLVVMIAICIMVFKIRYLTKKNKKLLAIS